MTTEARRVCVYCASSPNINLEFHTAASKLGQCLAEAGIEIIYGGGSLGSMGHLADGALAAGGRVLGILPRFMHKLEWGHSGLTELELVDTMHQRKNRMLMEADAVVALPGGCGTYEELFEAITFKQLGLYGGPIVLVNTRNYFAPLLALLTQAMDEGFMTRLHGDMWNVVGEPEQVIDGIINAPIWERPLDKFPER
ncbi:MAG: TIGR00730 family Rossman fold protein [Pseudomonadota bacterium]